MFRRFTSRSENQVRSRVFSPTKNTSGLQKIGISCLFLLAFLLGQNIAQAQCSIGCDSNPNSVVLPLDATGNEMITEQFFSPFYSSDDCSNGQVNLYADATLLTPYVSPNFNCNNIGDTEQVWLTVSDGNGNNESAFCEFVVTIADTYVPDLTCPANVSQPLTANNCNGVVNNIAPLLAYDNCAGLNVTYTLSGATTGSGSTDASGTTFNPGVTTLMYTATDNVGNSTFCSSTVALTFPQGAVINNCPADTTVPTDPGTCNYTLNYSAPNMVDNCPVTFTAAAGNTPSGTVVAPGDYNLEFTFNNGADNLSCMYTVSVRDQEDPTMITADQSITTSGCTANYSYNAASDISDNCSANADLTINYTLSGNGAFVVGTGANITNQVLNVGVYTIAFTVTDEAGNSVNHSWELEVLENILPVAQAMDITVELDLNGDVTVNAEDVDDGSSDNCSALTYEIAQDENNDNMPDNVPGADWRASFDYDCSDVTGTRRVLLRVIDANGNISSPVAAANITVEDNLTPVAQCQDITVTLMNGGNVTVDADDLDSGSSDNCNTITNYEITVDTNGDGVYDSGYAANYTVMCPTPSTGFLRAKMRVTDSSGSMTECLAKINTLDNTPPVAMAMNFTANIGANGTVTVSAAGFDNGSSEDCNAFNFTFALSQNGVYTAGKTFDCSQIGTYNDVYLRVTNTSGMSDTAGPVTLTVQDNTAPTADCVTSLTLGYDASGNISVPAAMLNNNSSDNCAGLSFAATSTTTGTFGTSVDTMCAFAPSTDLILRVRDASNNTSFCTVSGGNITVIDTIPPTAACNSFSVALVSSTVVVFKNQVNAQSVDACNGTVPSANISIARVENGTVGTYGNNVTFDCDDTGMQIVKLRAMDSAGLMSTCDATITIQETQPPVFTGTPANPTTVECSDYTVNGAQSFDAQATATDNCGTPVITFSDNASLSSCQVGTVIRTYTATDANGNTATASITLNIVDTTAPTFTAPADFNGECAAGGSGFGLANAGEVTDEADNCDPQATDGGLREATESTLHGYFDFMSHTNTTAPNYDFSPSTWTSGGTPDVTGAPASIFINTGDTFVKAAPATGFYSFDFVKTGSNNDIFQYYDNNVFTAATGNSGRITVAVTAGQNIGFRVINAGSGTTNVTISNFTFADSSVAPASIGCANNFDVARVWEMTDCQGNSAEPQLQRVRVQDTTAPAFNFTVPAVISSPDDNCSPFVDLDMSIVGRLIEECNLDSVRNTAAVDYGKGNGEEDASGFYAPGTYSVTFTAYDGCNSPTVFTIDFVVEDDTNPTLVCHDLVNVTIDNTGSVTLTPSTFISSVTDNCGLNNTAFTVTPNMFTNDDFGLNGVVVSVEDASGNATTCNSVANVVGSVEYDAAEVSGAATSTITLPIITRHFTDINSFQMTVNVTDTTVAKIVGISGFNPALTGTGNSNILNGGEADVSYFDGNFNLPDLDDAVLFNVEIELQNAATGSITPVTLTDVLSFRDDAGGTPQSVPTLTFDGSAEISAAASLRLLAGNIMTIETAENMDSVTVNLTGTTTNSFLTTTDGNYSFSVPAGADQTVTPFKDTNWRNGGNVNILDVLQLHRLSLGIDSYISGQQQIAADSDGDNTVNILDVLLAHRISLGTISEIPSNTSWRFISTENPVPAAPLTSGFPESRTYTNILSDISNAHFAGIKICDVAAPYASGIGFTSDDEDEARDSETLIFETENASVNAGEEMSVSLTAKDFNSISAYQFDVLFDAEYLQLNSVTPGTIDNMDAENFNANQSTNGILKTDWYNLHPVALTDGEVLFTLNFTALQSGVQLSDIFSVNADESTAFHYTAANEIGDIDLDFGTSTSVAPTPDSGFALLQNKPNPFAGRTLIPFVLPENGTATLTIFDAAGKAIFLEEIDGQRGYNEFDIDAEALPATGIFHYRLDSEAGSAVRKMVILR